MISFFLPGTPPTFTAQQKAVNFKARRFYKKPAAIAIDNLLTMAMKPFVPPVPMEGPLCVEVVWVFPYLKSDPKEIVKEGLLIRMIKSPDLVNMEKAVIDIAQAVGLIRNDSHISEEHLFKYRGPKPGIAVSIQAVPLLCGKHHSSQCFHLNLDTLRHGPSL